MKMKIPFVLPLFLVIGAIARTAAQDTSTNSSSPSVLTVAVYDFSDAEKGADNYGGKVTTLVTADLTDETNLVMLERAELNKALQEQALGISGMVSSDAAAKIGQITGAKVLVAGQVIKSAGNLIIVANIIGTETGRLFADKVQGPADALVQLTSDLSRKIAQTITDQSTNLVNPAPETHAERLERIVKSIKGKNRPSVSVDIKLLRPDAHGRSAACEEEFGNILLKAGFTVVDENSNQKPDIEITGVANYSTGTREGQFYSSRGVLELKVQERQTGRIIAFDHQESVESDPGQRIANRGAQVNAVDDLAVRILPLLAQ
jgi:TolB-like protein